MSGAPDASVFGDDVPFDPEASTGQMAKLAKDAGLDVEAIEVPGDHLTMLDAAIPKAVAYFTSLAE